MSMQPSWKSHDMLPCRPSAPARGRGTSPDPRASPLSSSWPPGAKRCITCLLRFLRTCFNLALVFLSPCASVRLLPALPLEFRVTGSPELSPGETSSLSAKDWVADNLAKRMAKDGPAEVFTGDQAEGPISLSGQSNLSEVFAQVPEVAAPSKKLRRKYQATAT